MEAKATNKDIFTITMPRNLDDPTLEQFQTELKSWLLQSQRVFVLDFAESLDLPQNFLSEILKLSRTLKTNEKFIASLNVNQRITELLKDKGVLQSFNPVDDLSSFVKRCGLTPPASKNTKSEFVNSFVDATKKALEVQASMHVDPSQKPYVRQPGEAPENIAIAGVINVSSSEFNGSIGLYFRRNTFLKIYKNMTDEEHLDINDEIQDAVGELLNIIYGLAKAELVNEKGYDLKPAIPSVLAGEKLKVQYHSKSPVVVLPFKCEAGEFYIEIVLETQTKSQAA